MFFKATCANTNCSSIETCDDTPAGAQCVCNDGYTRNQTSGLCQSELTSFGSVKK